jgi:3',5'-cyclic AMP phosphodiesterase CpdA
MSTRILHISDLHLGAHRGQQDALFGVAFAALIERLDPALVIVTGDLTHRGSHDQHDQAAVFLRSLDRPLLVVPGNHDLPHLPVARLMSPWREFERVWGTTEPLHVSPGLRVVGLNSARPLHHQSGRIGRGQLARAASRLGEGDPGDCRVAAFHHQMVGAPWRSRKRPLAARSTVLATLTAAGAELIVSGHIHQASVSLDGEFRLERAGVVVTTTPGLGRPRPRRKGEACGALAYTIEAATIQVETFLWHPPAFELAASRVFPRRGGNLAAAAAAADAEDAAAPVER